MLDNQLIEIMHILIRPVIRLDNVNATSLKLLDVLMIVPFKRSQIFEILTHFNIRLLVVPEQRSPQLAEKPNDRRWL